jgi:hypothetical protein
MSGFNDRLKDAKREYQAKVNEIIQELISNDWVYLSDSYSNYEDSWCYSYLADPEFLDKEGFFSPIISKRFGSDEEIMEEINTRLDCICNLGGAISLLGFENVDLTGVEKVEHPDSE